jgi:hypothetical protein
MRIQTGLFILAGLLLWGAAEAQQVEFNYEGRVIVDGLPYGGPGYFKFAIVDPKGNLTLWSNDATLFNADERVSLCMWFSDTRLAGSFKALKLDREIANPGLQGLQSH